MNGGRLGDREQRRVLFASWRSRHRRALPCLVLVITVPAALVCTGCYLAGGSLPGNRVARFGDVAKERGLV